MTPSRLPVSKTPASSDLDNLPVNRRADEEPHHIAESASNDLIRFFVLTVLILCRTACRALFGVILSHHEHRPHALRLTVELARKGIVMAPQSKGSRRAPTIRLPEEVIEKLQQGRMEAGTSSFSQYVSDVLAIHVGRPDLARELNNPQEVLPLTA